MISRILVSGSSGLVGTALLTSLNASGYKVVRLVRRPANGGSEIFWDPAQPISPDLVSGFDAVIHLAGESIMGRWTEAKKARIRDSRIPATIHLAQALAQAKQKPSVFISASAIGYYGNRGEEVLTENSPFGSGFAADLAHEWELATTAAAQAGIRTANIRIGIVMSAKGGALKSMLPPFKMGVGGRVGSGHQWMSWVDLQDVVGSILHILKTDALSGPVNLVSPNPVTNEEFTKVLASVLHRPAIFPVPAFAVRLLFGQMADELLLGSQRVEPTKLAASGYPYRFSDVRASLEAILKT